MIFAPISVLHAAGIVFFDQNRKLEETLHFPENLQNKNIAQKEAIAILWMLQRHQAAFKQKHIIQFCDNQIVCWAYKNFGSSNTALNDIIREIN